MHRPEAESGTLSRLDNVPTRAGALRRPGRTNEEPRLRVLRSGDIMFGRQKLTEVELRQMLTARGLVLPVPTKAKYDETTEDLTGWRFMLVPRWFGMAVAAAAYVAIGVAVIAAAIGWIVSDVDRGDVNAIDSPMAYIVGTLLYLTVGVWIFVWVVREKHQKVNRFDPRTWIRELCRISRRARKPLTDSDIEDQLLDAWERSTETPPALSAPL
ncbi:hypothetical protein [Humibacter antri]